MVVYISNEICSMPVSAFGVRPSHNHYVAPSGQRLPGRTVPRGFTPGCWLVSFQDTTFHTCFVSLPGVSPRVIDVVSFQDTIF